MATPIVFPAPAVALPPALTDAELADEFVAMVERPEDPRQVPRPPRGVRRWLKKHDLSLLSARRPDIARYFAYLKSDQRSWHDSHKNPVFRPLGPSSRKGVLAALRAFYRHCAVMDYISHDPTFGIETPKVEIKRGLSLTRHELRRFLDAPGTPRCRVQAYLQVYTAGRAASIGDILWTDVDFERNVIHLNAKNGKHYTLPIHPQLRAALLRWRHEQVENAESNPKVTRALENPETAWVLLTRNGKKLSHSTLGKQAKWRAARAGLYPHPLGASVSYENKSQLSPHALRRSFAVLMRSEGTALEDIAEVLNQIDLNTTRNHYAFTDTPRTRRTINSFTV